MERKSKLWPRQHLRARQVGREAGTWMATVGWAVPTTGRRAWCAEPTLRVNEATLHICTPDQIARKIAALQGNSGENSRHRRLTENGRGANRTDSGGCGEGWRSNFFQPPKRKGHVWSIHTATGCAATWSDPSSVRAAALSAVEGGAIATSERSPPR